MPFCRQPEIGTEFKQKSSSVQNQETRGSDKILTVSFDVGGTLERYDTDEPFAELVNMALEMAVRPEKYRVLIVTDNPFKHMGPQIIKRYCQEMRRNNTIGDDCYLYEGDLRNIDVDVAFDDMDVSYLKNGKPTLLYVKVATLQRPGKELSYAWPGSKEFRPANISDVRNTLGLPAEQEIKPQAILAVQMK